MKKYFDIQKKFIKLFNEFESELNSGSIGKLKSQIQLIIDDAILKFEEKLKSKSTNLETIQKRIDKLQSTLQSFKTKSQPKQLTIEEKSAITIQRIYRGHLIRKKFREIGKKNFFY